MIRKLIALCLLSVYANVCWAAHTSSPLLGKWEARPDDSTHITYEFKHDGTVFWMYEQGTIWSGITAKYRINEKVQPVQIDLYEFSDPDMAGVTIHGIMVFDDAEHLRIAAAKELRPTEFGASTVNFVRVQASSK